MVPADSKEGHKNNHVLPEKFDLDFVLSNNDQLSGIRHKIAAHPITGEQLFLQSFQRHEEFEIAGNATPRHKQAGLTSTGPRHCLQRGGRAADRTVARNKGTRTQRYLQSRKEQ